MFSLPNSRVLCCHISSLHQGASDYDRLLRARLLGTDSLSDIEYVIPSIRYCLQLSFAEYLSHLHILHFEAYRL